jgi:hypothetical protein
MTLSSDQTRALRLLDEAEPRGCTEAVMRLAHGFKAELLAGLVHDDLASMAAETITAGDQPIESNKNKAAAPSSSLGPVYIR